MEVQTTLIDLDRVYKAIENLNDFQKDKAVQQGLKDATGLFINAGRQNLRDRMKSKKGDSGDLLKSFRSKLKRSSLGAIAGFNQLGMHAHLIDLGTQERTTKSGANRGKVEGNSFWKDAIESNETAAIDKVYSGIERAITNLINKG